jgi:hypothetical protein
MSFQAGIFGALVNDVTLTALVPATSIYYQRIPPGVKIPLISFFTTGGPGPDWTFEPDYYETIEFQVSIFTELPDTTNTVAKRVDHLLCWQPIPFDDVRNMGVFRTSPIDNLLLEPEVDEVDQDVWMTPLIYQARLIRILN